MSITNRRRWIVRSAGGKAELDRINGILQDYVIGLGRHESSFLGPNLQSAVGRTRPVASLGRHESWKLYVSHLTKSILNWANII